MSIVVGDKKSIALECNYSIVDKTLDGNIYLHVSGHRFGESAFTYSVEDAIHNVINYFQLDDIDFQNLFECPINELMSSFDMAYAEDVGVDESLLVKNMTCEADDYLAGFMAHFATSSDLDHCVFRQGNYAFDNCTIITIPSGNLIRLYIRDDETNESADTIISINGFMQLWKDLRDKLIESQHNHN